MHRLFVLLSVALWGGVFVVRALAVAPSPPAATPPPPMAALAIAASPPAGAAATGGSQEPGGYVGQETCVTCHEGLDTSINATKHGFAMDARSPAATHGCESCHGPGEAHVDGGGDKSKIKSFTRGGATPAETSETCATCHNRGEHALWEGSQHEGRDLTCTTCHSVHNPQSETMQLRAVDQRGLCATCHRDKIAKLDRSGHMPVREGKLQCTTCHNVHGTTNVRLLRKGDSVGELCTSCHAEKRGP